jgi:hypothetical protein
LKNDGLVVGWGSYTNVPAGLSNVTAIACGYIQSYALKGDGTLTAWQASGSINVPAGISNVVGISVGDGHVLALRNDGSVLAWGGNSSGESDVPTTLSNVVAVAAGNAVSIAVTGDGHIVTWGANYNGEGNIPQGLSNVVLAAVGGGYVVAVKADLQIGSIALTNQTPSIQFHTFSGLQYSVQYSSNLTSGAWFDLPGGNVSGNGHAAVVADTNTTANVSTKFYRVKQHP